MKIPRPIYSAAMYLAMPLASLYLLKRAKKQPQYKEHWSERFGTAHYRTPQSGRPVVWVHAVSVGETRAAFPLIELMLKRWPSVDVMMTCMTPTGRQTAADFAHKHGSRISVCYLPYDTPFAVKRFIKTVKPAICVLMETEVWPNLVHFCRKFNIPVVLANARLSQKSFDQGAKTGGLVFGAMAKLSAVLAQSETDAERFRATGAKAVQVAGNMKFDFTPNAAQINTGHTLRSLGGRKVVLLASTRDGEEAMFLPLIAEAAKGQEILWMIVPRHPQRFEAVAELVQKQGLSFKKRSETRHWKEVFSPDGPNVLIGDSMGEMDFYYAMADVVLMGGSFGPYGSQSVIEPFAAGAPVVVGPSVFNFETAVNEAEKAQALVRAQSAGDGFNQALALISDEQKRAQLAGNAQAFAASQRGAAERNFQKIDELLSEKNNANKAS